VETHKLYELYEYINASRVEIGRCLCAINSAGTSMRLVPRAWAILFRLPEQGKVI
jgi:hypothetical protein